MDLLAGRGEERCINALRHLRELSAFCVLLGCFPQDGVAFDDDADADAKPLICHPAASLRSAPLRVAIIGFGTFGQFLARRWVLRRHRVLATSRTDYSAEAAEMGVECAPRDRLSSNPRRASDGGRQPAAPARPLTCLPPLALSPRCGGQSTARWTSSRSMRCRRCLHRPSRRRAASTK